MTVEITAKTDVPNVLIALDEKLKSLKEITDKTYRTSGVLDLGGESIDIKKETKVENLIIAYGSVKAREAAYVAGAEELGVTTFPVYNVSGGTAADWKEDIKLRLNVIQYEGQKNKLQSYKDRMSKFLSEQDQKDMLIKEMMESLGGGV